MRIQSVADANAAMVRHNALISDSMGIGFPETDPIENIDAIDTPIFGGQARIIYRGLPIVQRIIDIPAMDCLRPDFHVTTKFDKYGIGELIHERFEELKYREKFIRWLIHSRLYSRGALMLPILRETNMRPDRLHYQQKLDLNYLERIESLNVIREDLFYYIVQQFDPFAANFEDFESVNVLGQPVHPSRSYLYVSSLDPTRQRGTSVLERILIACKGLNIAQWSIAQNLLKYRTAVLSFPAKELDRIQAGTKDGAKTNIAKLLDSIKMQFSAKSAVAMPDTYKLDYLTTSFEGLQNATNYLNEFLSMVSHIPQSIIKGSAEGDIASARENKRNYYELIESEERHNKLVPAMLWVAKLIIHEREGKVFQRLRQYGINPHEVHPLIEFEPMSSVDPLTDAQVDFTKMQTAALAIERQIMNPDEARRELYPELTGYSTGEYDDSSGSLAWDAHEPLDMSEEQMSRLKVALQRLKQ